MQPSCLFDGVRRLVRGAREVAARLGVLILAVLAGLAQAQVLDTPDRSQALNQVAWTHKDGAPIRPNDMAQTEDGLLWLGGQTGLYRFNAGGFERVEIPGAPQLRIERLFPTHDGGLWIGYIFNSAADRKSVV